MHLTWAEHKTAIYYVDVWSKTICHRAIRADSENWLVVACRRMHIIQNVDHCERCRRHKFWRRCQNWTAIKTIHQVVADSFKLRYLTEWYWLPLIRSQKIIQQSYIQIIFQIFNYVIISIIIRKEICVFCGFSQGIQHNINSEKVQEAIQILDIDRQIRHITKEIYRGNGVQVKVRGQLSETIEVTKGLRQICNMSPRLMENL